MVAVVTGAGLGLDTSSQKVFAAVGQQGGVLGDSSFGRYGENVTVNAATGNLMIDRTDEVLLGVGPDDVIGRAYNSQSQNQGYDAAHDWQFSDQRSINLVSGSIDGSGSTLLRIDSDGSNTTYTWDSGAQAYICHQAGNAEYRITYSTSSGTPTWTWTDAANNISESYDIANGGRLCATKDTYGNALAYHYDPTSGLLQTVTTADGETTTFNYSGTNVSSIVTAKADGTTLTRIYYHYDSYGRLSWTKVDLSPNDNTLTGNSVKTTYSYDGTSDRVISIVQTGGAELDISYTQLSSGAYVVQSITQVVNNQLATAATQTTSFAYNSGNTVITDQNGNTTTLYFDASDQLKKVVYPADINGSKPVYKYSYDSDGDLKTVTDALTNVVASYTYDVPGETDNLLTAQDFYGNTYTYTYDTSNHVVIKTLTPGNGQSVQSSATQETTRYAYNSKGSLRFIVDPDGEVTEYQYNSVGERTAVIGYTASTYSVSGLGSTATISETPLANWVLSMGSLSAITERTDYAYDFRGNLSTETSYSTDNADGTGNGNAVTTIVKYVYDQAGNLLQRYKTNVTTGTTTNVEQWVYDGLNRVTSHIDLLGSTTATQWTDASNMVQVTFTNGLIQTSQFDDAGNLTSFTQASSTLPTETTTYTYDTMQQLSAVNQADSAVSGGSIDTYYLYDNLGRKVAAIADDGSITEYRYDADSHVIATIGYNTKLTGAQLTSLITSNGTGANPSVASIRPVSDPGDVWNWNIYDSDGRLIETIDGDGDATTFAYDDMSNITSTTSYYNTLSPTQISNFQAAAPTTAKLPNASSHDDISYTYYDDEGRVIGMLDGDGNLARSFYDDAGQKIQTTYYATQVPDADQGAAWSTILGDVAPVGNPNQNDVSNYFVYDGRGLLVYALDGQLRATQYVYDGYGNHVETTLYNGAIQAGSSYTQSYVQAQLSPLQGDNQNRSSFNVYNTLTQTLDYTIDAMGGVTKFLYDNMGNVVLKTQYFNAYSPSTPPSSQTVSSNVQASLANDRTTRYAYDSAGHLRFVVDPEGFVTETRYSTGGRALLSIAYATTYNGLSIPTETQMESWAGSTIPASAQQTGYGYDVDGRLIDTVDDVTGFAVDTHTDYDNLGRVLQVTQAYLTGDASKIRYAYDTANRLTSVTRGYQTADASTTSYTYDGQGNVLTTIDGDNNTTTFTYDNAGQLLSKKDALNDLASYTYDSFGNVITTTDPLGNVSYAWYDALNRVVLQADQLGYLTATTYTIGGAIKSVTRYAKPVTIVNGNKPTSIPTDPKDATTLFARDKLDRVTQTTDAEGYFESYQLDAFGDRLAVIAKSSTAAIVAGGETDYTYGQRGEMLTETGPVAAYTSNGAVEKSTIVDTYTYDAFGNMKTKVEASNTTEKRTTTYAYDGLNRLTTVTGDALTVVDDTNINNVTSNFVPTTTYTYDLRGNVIKTVDASGAVTQSYYDHLDRKIAQIDAMGDYAKWTYDDNGNILTASAYDKAFSMSPPPAAGGSPPLPPTGSTARLTTYVYDAINRLRTTTVANVLTGSYSGTSYATTTGNVVATNIYDKSINALHQVDGNGNDTWTYYDNLGRIVASVDGNKYVTLYTLDSNGNVLQETRYANAYGGVINDNTQLTTIKNYFDPAQGAHNDTVNDRATVFTYDRNGRRLTETRLNVAYATVSGASVATNTGNSVVTYAYNGLGEVLTKTEATNDSTSYTYDAAGRQIAVDEFAFTQNSVTKQLHTVQLYDGLGDLVYSDSYDSHNTGDQRITKYTYGAGGRLASVTDPTNFTRTFSYDKMGRTVLSSYQRLHSDGSYTTEADVMLYDALGRVSSQGTATSNGTTWSLNDMQGQTYDTFGEVVAKNINGVTQQTYAYDNAGRMWQSTDEGVYTLYLYDANGNQTLSVTSDGTALASGSWSTFTESGSTSYVTAMGTIGAAVVPGMVETITVYDDRDQATSTRMPQRQLSANYYNANDVEDINLYRTYNAFGEVLTEKDGNSHITTYTYNTMGKVTSQALPATTVYDEHNNPSTINPTQYNYYDLSGRLVGVKDANGNVNTLALLANTGYDGSDAQTTDEYHADGGHVVNIYDAFGELTENVNEVSAVTDYAYDKDGNLLTETHPTGAGGLRLVDTYTYDGLGQRLTHYNSEFGSSYVDRTDYDAEGRVTQTVDMEGHATTTGYAWSNALTTTGLGQFGGVTKTTTLVDSSRSETEEDDADGRTIGKTDFGGNVYGYTYDSAGRLSVRTDSYIPAGALSGGGYTPSGEVLTYTYYNTGLTKEITSDYELVTEMVYIPITDYYDTHNIIITDYSYDKNGNQVFEDTIDRSVSTMNGGTPFDMLVEYETATYNNLNRMTSLQDTAPAISGVYTTIYDPITINWKYDANGNIRNRASTYYLLDPNGNGDLSTTQSSQSDWYTYDSMNRFLITEGTLDQNNNIVTTATGTTITYDKAGERLTATGNGETDTYHYSADGHVTQADIATSGGTEHAYYTNDLMGRVLYYEEDNTGGTKIYSKQTTYNHISQDTQDVVYTVRPNDGTYTWTTTYDFREHGSNGYNGVYDDGAVTHTSTSTVKQGGGGPPGTDAVYSYMWSDGAVELGESYDSDTGNSNNTIWTSTPSYDQRHDLMQAAILDGYDHGVAYQYNIDGEVTYRQEGVAYPVQAAPIDMYFYFGGVQIGNVSTNGTSNVGYVASITQQTTKPGNGFFTDGATSGTAYADFDQSYDAINGLTYGQSPSTYTVQAGDTLQSIAQQIWGDLNFWYLLADANGLDASSQLDAGITLVVPNDVANNQNNTSTYRVYDPNSHIGDISPTHPPKPQPNHSQCGVFGEILEAIIAAVVTVLAPELIPEIAPAALGVVGSAVVSATLGDAVAQGVGLATGIQKSFNWDELGLTAVGAAVGAALGPGGAFGKDGLFPTIGGSQTLGAFVRGSLGNAITQGIGVATGLQKSFNWADVAAAGMQAGVSSWVSSSMLSDNPTLPKAGVGFVAGMAGDIAFASTRSLVDGSDFGDNLIKGLPNVVAQTIGGALEDAEKQATVAQRVQALQNMGNKYAYTVDAYGNINFLTDPNGNMIKYGSQEDTDSVSPQTTILGVRTVVPYDPQPSKQDLIDQFDSRMTALGATPNPTNDGSFILGTDVYTLDPTYHFASHNPDGTVNTGSEQTRDKFLDMMKIINSSANQGLPPLQQLQQIPAETHGGTTYTTIYANALFFGGPTVSTQEFYDNSQAEVTKDTYVNVKQGDFFNFTVLHEYYHHAQYVNSGGTYGGDEMLANTYALDQLAQHQQLFQSIDIPRDIAPVNIPAGVPSPLQALVPKPKTP